MTEDRQAKDGYIYNPFDRTTYDAIAYNAIGRASETGTYPSLALIHSTGNSGWSVGAMQWNFGQPSRGDMVNDMLSGYQTWAADDQKFTGDQISSLTTRLQTRGQVGNELSQEEQDKLNAYLRSDSGREFVSGLNQMQVERKWNNVGQPLSQIPWLQELGVSDPAQAAEIIAMTSKLYNQNENRGGLLIQHLQANQVTSEQTSEWIGTQGISGLRQSARDAIVSGRDATLSGIRLMNQMEQGTGRISQAWSEQIHIKGNASLIRDFNNNPDVQLLDGMMRSPSAGARIFSHIDGGMDARAATVSGINTDARLEMSRTELDQGGVLTVRSPNGDVYEMTHGSWTRNGVATQTDPAPQAQAPDSQQSPVQLTPQVPQRLDNPEHPDHAFFQQAREHVYRLDQQIGRVPDQQSDNIASALTVQARADGLQRIDQIALSTDGKHLWAVQTPQGRADHLFDLQTNVPTAAVNTPMEQSAVLWPQAMQQYQEIQLQSQEQSQNQVQQPAVQGPQMVR